MKRRAVFCLMLLSVLSSALPASPDEEAPVLVGLVTRGEIEAAEPTWNDVLVESKPDLEAARALASVPPGAEVLVFFGTWCGDSRREVPRFWRALDETGNTVPFHIRYVGVDRQKKQPGEMMAYNDVHYVPTFIVSRDGHEVGRIVESSPHGVERDLLALLKGEEKGLITDREDLKTQGSAKPPL
ncbi:MAG TPA: thioredoxin family protein [Thermoanaerobaculia bacterium]|nr:thioredoxin family protein [Thermoanaerobaculia bacterium]